MFAGWMGMHQEMGRGENDAEDRRANCRNKVLWRSQGETEKAGDWALRSLGQEERKTL